MTSAKDVTGNVSQLVGSVTDRLPDIGIDDLTKRLPDPDEVIGRLKDASGTGVQVLREGAGQASRWTRFLIPLAVAGVAFGGFMVVRSMRSKRTTTVGASRPSETYSRT
jgi:hypothetical protein